MDFVQIIFLGLALLAVVAAFSVILQRNPIYSAIGMIIVLCSLAGLFLLLYAQFIAAIQIVVYAGAIMVLFVFVIMLLNVREEESKTDRQKYLKWLAGPLFLALLAVVFVAIQIVNSTPQAINMPVEPATFGTVEYIAGQMFTRYLLPFEAVSVLILMAIVGAVLLAKREKKEDIERIEHALSAHQSIGQETLIEKSKEEVAA
ncbi:MAG: NADH-quinone oxidoreductase subunit J [Blastocatellia bacterium]|nr:NADH-quinone oxidoreductase subunit J [Blastocatellia bacterium]